MLINDIQDDFAEVLKNWIKSNWHKAVPSPVESYFYYGIDENLKNEFFELDEEEQTRIEKILKRNARIIEISNIVDDDYGILKAIMADYNLTASDVAKKMKYTKQYISLLISKKQSIPEDFIEKLIDTLD